MQVTNYSNRNKKTSNRANGGGGRSNTLLTVPTSHIGFFFFKRYEEGFGFFITHSGVSDSTLETRETRSFGMMQTDKFEGCQAVVGIPTRKPVPEDSGTGAYPARPGVGLTTCAACAEAAAAGPAAGRGAAGGASSAPRGPYIRRPQAGPARGGGACTVRTCRPPPVRFPPEVGHLRC